MPKKKELESLQMKSIVLQNEKDKRKKDKSKEPITDADRAKSIPKKTGQLILGEGKSQKKRADIQGLNKYLVVTPYRFVTNDGSAVSEIFQQFHFRILSQDPYIVVIGSDLEPMLFIENLRRFPFEYEITP